MLCGAAAILLSSCGGGTVSPASTADASQQVGDAGAEKEAASPDASDPRAAGRALEAGDPEEARELLGDVTASTGTRYLGAMIALDLGEHDEAIRLLRGLKGFDPALEGGRRRMIVDALARAGRESEAADEIAVFLSGQEDLGGGERRKLERRMGDLLLLSGRPEEAVEAYGRALKGAKGKAADSISLEMARAMLKAKGEGRREEALGILSRLAGQGASKGAMTGAMDILEDLGEVPEWTDAQRMERSVALMERKAWDAALETLGPLLEGEGKNVEEAAWFEARILFKRRRHYREAIEALEPIVAGGRAHSLEALFLKARALSRLDRDEEAIRLYRSFAKKTKAIGRSGEARFLACRLEFYLGKHKEALVNLQKLVGNGKQKRAPRSGLGPSRVRDAHFLAGISALLAGKPVVAQPHLEAASKGSSSVEAIERNEYWYAVARMNARNKNGSEMLEDICEKDPSGWYSLQAARRLEEAGYGRVKCAAVNAGGPDEADGGAPDAGADEELVPLEEISGTAAFLAEIGLFREAARFLREAEKAGAGEEADTRDWIGHYVALDAPQHAIRRAARGLGWPPAPEDRWKAEAAYPTPYEDLVRRQEEKHGLPRDLIYAIARKESLFDPHAVSWVGALGMMQMMPHTYETNRKRAGLEPLKEGQIPGPRDSIEAAACELEHLLELFDGQLPLAIMAYNGGSAAVKRWLERSGDLPMDVFVEKAGFAQTRNYVRRVTKSLVRYRTLYGGEPVDIPATAKRPAKDQPDAGAKDAGAE